jgi:multidrug efflux pump subunit AcrA (membrane-fusion protein)
MTSTLERSEPLMWGRVSWSTAALAVVVALAVALWATGRLEVHWRPESRTAEETDDHEHEKEGPHLEEEGGVQGDKAILDAGAVKAAGLRAEPVRKGSIAVAIEVSGEVQVADNRIAQVTPRISGVVREIHKARGETVTAGAALAVIESADLGDARAAYETALTELKLAETNLQAWRRVARSADGPAGVAGAGWLELDQAMAEQEAAATEKSVAERGVARMKQLHERGLRSRTEVLAADADLARAQSRSAAAERSRQRRDGDRPTGRDAGRRLEPDRGHRDEPRALGRPDGRQHREDLLDRRPQRGLGRRGPPRS